MSKDFEAKKVVFLEEGASAEPEEIFNRVANASWENLQRFKKELEDIPTPPGYEDDPDYDWTGTVLEGLI